MSDDPVLRDPEAFWTRARELVASLPDEVTATPDTAKVGAVLVVLADTPDGLELVLTRRRDDMRSHPGQVSFPGGRVEPGESIVTAALREAHEETGLEPDSVEVIGRGPSFYIPPSRFWVAPVLARWTRPHQLVASPDEVDEVLRVPMADLLDEERWRSVPLSVGGGTWAWQLDDDLLWGATAMTVGQLLEGMVPDWHGGAAPAEFPADRQVRPWEDMPRTPARRRLSGGLPSRSIDDLPVIDVDTMRAIDEAAADAGWPLGSMSEQAGRALAHATRRLLDPDALLGARVTVLVGSGGNGAGGLVAARLLAAGGAEVEVVLVDDDGRVAVPGQLTVLRAAGVPIHRIHGLDLGTVTPGDVVIDAMVGMGATPPLRGNAEVLAQWLRAHVTRVVANDLPSGLGGDIGLRGPGVTADVTVTVGLPKQGLTPPIVQPYLGDLYLADLGIPPGLWASIGVEVPADLFADGPLVRLVLGDGDVNSDAGTPDQGVASRSS